jgi:hypothetical protein
VERLAAGLLVVEAVAAGVAGDVVVRGDAVADVVLRHPLADLDDVAGDLVAQDDGRLLDPVPFHYIRAAYARGADAEQYLARAGRRLRPVLDADVGILVVDGCLHRVSSARRVP